MKICARTSSCHRQTLHLRNSTIDKEMYIFNVHGLILWLWWDGLNFVVDMCTGLGCINTAWTSPPETNLSHDYGFQTKHACFLKCWATLQIWYLPHFLAKARFWSVRWPAYLSPWSLWTQIIPFAWFTQLRTVKLNSLDQCCTLRSSTSPWRLLWGCQCCRKCFWELWDRSTRQLCEVWEKVRQAGDTTHLNIEVNFMICFLYCCRDSSKETFIFGSFHNAFVPLWQLKLV